MSLAADRFAKADTYSTTVDGFAVRPASREQAVVDAFGLPRGRLTATLHGQPVEEAEAEA